MIFAQPTILNRRATVHVEQWHHLALQICIAVSRLHSYENGLDAI